MADMTPKTADDGFHEIQLSGKQLVFLFMATTVVSVVFSCAACWSGAACAARRCRRGRQPRSPGRAQPPPSPEAARRRASASPSRRRAQPSADGCVTKRLPREGRAENRKAPKSVAASRARGATPPPALQQQAVEAAEPAPKNPTPKRPTSTRHRQRPLRRYAPSQSRPLLRRAGVWVVQLVALRDRGARSAIVQRLSGKGYPRVSRRAAGACGGPDIQGAGRPVRRQGRGRARRTTGSRRKKSSTPGSSLALSRASSSRSAFRSSALPPARGSR